MSEIAVPTPPPADDWFALLHKIRQADNAADKALAKTNTIRVPAYQKMTLDGFSPAAHADFVKQLKSVVKSDKSTPADVKRAQSALDKIPADFSHVSQGMYVWGRVTGHVFNLGPVPSDINPTSVTMAVKAITTERAMAIITEVKGSDTPQAESVAAAVKLIMDEAKEKLEDKKEAAKSVSKYLKLAIQQLGYAYAMGADSFTDADAATLLGLHGDAGHMLKAIVAAMAEAKSAE